jgi:hypothetical protein
MSSAQRSVEMIKVIGPYLIPVNHRRSIEEGVAAGEYKVVNPLITAQNFPLGPKGIETLRILVVSRVRSSDAEGVRNVLRGLGFRTLSLQELLFLGEKQPDLQREGTIWGLGTTFREEGYSPYLSLIQGHRVLGLARPRGGFISNWDRFAVVAQAG